MRFQNIENDHMRAFWGCTGDTLAEEGIRVLQLAPSGVHHLHGPCRRASLCRWQVPELSRDFDGFSDALSSDLVT